MNRLLNLFKASVGVNKKPETTKTVVNGHTIEVERIDAKLRLDIRIGALVSFPESRIPIVQALGSSINVSAKSQDSKILAIGSYHLGDYKVYRTYITQESDNQEFIQILTHEDKDGKIIVDEAVLFSSFFIDYPTNEDGWQYYRDAFNSETYTNDLGQEYNRVTEGETHANFTLVYSPDGSKGEDLEIEYQLYERNLSDDSSEFTLVEITDHVEKGKAEVWFYTGIPLSISEVKFIPTI